MLGKILHFLKNIFKKKQIFEFDPSAVNISEAFNFPEGDYKKIVNDLTGYISTLERLAALDFYLKKGMPEKYKLDINNPSHAALLGYAFCTAVILQSNLKTQSQVNKFFKDFYGNKLKSPQPIVN